MRVFNGAQTQRPGARSLWRANVIRTAQHGGAVRSGGSNEENRGLNDAEIRGRTSQMGMDGNGVGAAMRR